MLALGRWSENLMGRSDFQRSARSATHLMYERIGVAIQVYLHARVDTDCGGASLADVVGLSRAKVVDPAATCPRLDGGRGLEHTDT